MQKTENELVSVKMPRDTNQKARVIASLEGMTVQEWFSWVVDKAYDTKKRHFGRKSA